MRLGDFRPRTFGSILYRKHRNGTATGGNRHAFGDQQTTLKFAGFCGIPCSFASFAQHPWRSMLAVHCSCWLLCCPLSPTTPTIRQPTQTSGFPLLHRTEVPPTSRALRPDGDCWRVPGPLTSSFGTAAGSMHRDGNPHPCTPALLRRGRAAHLPDPATDGLLRHLFMKQSIGSIEAGSPATSGGCFRNGWGLHGSPFSWPVAHPTPARLWQTHPAGNSKSDNSQAVKRF